MSELNFHEPGMLKMGSCLVLLFLKNEQVKFNWFVFSTFVFNVSRESLSEFRMSRTIMSDHNLSAIELVKSNLQSVETI